MGGVTTAPAGAGADVDDEVLLARAFLSRSAEPACIPLWKLVRAVGPVEAARRLRAGETDDSVLAGLAQRVGGIDPHAELDAAVRHGVRLVVPESAEWQHFAFSALERTGEARLEAFDHGRRAHAERGEDLPPLALWVRGPLDLSSSAVRSVGIVGARSATPYGQRIASDLGYGLALRDFTVVSGGAYGIDAAAHRGALGADGVTVIVSAGGVERPYPPSHGVLFEQVAATGAIVSESPVGCSPRRGRFLTRNRLIAALSTGTVIVEASARSGALNTAGHAERLDRPLMVVPGPVTSAMSVGCHDLLRKVGGPGELVTGVDDVVAVIGSSGDVSTGLQHEADEKRAAPAAGQHRSAAAIELLRRLDTVDPSARAVYDGMPASREITVEELAVACAVSPLDVIRSVPVLELAGLIQATRDGYRRRVAR